MFKKVCLFLLVIISLIFLNMLYAGTTGKISGMVKDAETGDPLPGVNVVLEGTTLGAATDTDGTYVILNVPPGVYTVVFTYIGYQGVRVKDVRVNVDFTTRVDQKLRPTALQMEAVEVLGERNPLVRVDLTNTQVAVTAETINELPVDQIRDVIALQAGIVVDNSGNIHIRGGRSNEISYQVNGLSINNPFGNSQGVGLATNAVEEVSVSTGTFSAEYGNALSGVINFVTKDGGPKYDWTFRAWSGDFISTRKDLFFNIDDVDPFNNRRAEWTFGGPVPFFNKKVTFFTSGVWQNDKGYLYGIRIYKPEDRLVLDGANMLIDPEGLVFVPGPNNTILIKKNSALRGANGDRKIVPMVTREAINLTGKLSWKVNPGLKISYDILVDNGTRYNRVANGVNAFRRFRFTPDGRPKTISRNISHSVSVTQTLTKKMFYTLKLGVNYNRALTAVFEDKFDPRYIPSVQNNLNNQLVQPTDYVAGGMDLGRTEEKNRSLIAKIDFVSQVLPNHEIRFGGEYAQHRLDLEAYTLLFNELSDSTGRFIIPKPEENPSFTNYQAYRREPIQGSFYILDKMELAKTFIFNVGLRYEYFNSRARYNPDIAGTVDKGVNRPEFLKKAKPKHRFMPRISLSFPITARGIIRFSYGIFYQYPTLRNIYRNPRYEDFNFATTPFFGNANLEPQRSIQYEMGLQQQFTDNIKMDLTLFYKDVNNLIDDRRVIAGEVAIDKEFNVYTNIGYAKIKGFTISFLKRRSPGGLFSASLDYTFQIGKGSFTNPLALAVDVRTGRQTPQKLIPLSFDRRHTINATLTLSKPRNYVFSAIGQIWSGTPYTPSVPSSIQPVRFEVNSARKPWTRNVDIKFEKFFYFSDYRFSVFLQVENVFDTKNELFVHTNTGSALSNLQESLNPNLFNNLIKTIDANPRDFFPKRFIKNFYKREDWLSKPRQVRLGVSFQI